LPGKATLVSPSGAGVANPVEYQWNHVVGATWYLLWVNNGANSNVIKEWFTAEQAGCSDVSGNPCRVQPTVTLLADNHTWWIQTWNSAGYGPWSDPMTFRTGSVPPKATLIGPSGGGITSPVEFDWNRVGQATYYYLWVNKGSTNVIKEWHGQCGSEVSGNPCRAMGYNLGPGNYTWWIQTWNPNGYGPWSDPMTFTIGAVPGKATLVSPSGTNFAYPVEYQWTHVTGATYYYLWVNRGSTPIIQKWFTASEAGCSDVSGNPCRVSSAQAGVGLTPGAHTWWILTWNPNGYGPWSDGMEFLVQSPF
jgi:hypothetical protein